VRRYKPGSRVKRGFERHRVLFVADFNPEMPWHRQPAAGHIPQQSAVHKLPDLCNRQMRMDVSLTEAVHLFKTIVPFCTPLPVWGPETNRSPANLQGRANPGIGAAGISPETILDIDNAEKVK